MPESVPEQQRTETFDNMEFISACIRIHKDEITLIEADDRKNLHSVVARIGNFTQFRDTWLFGRHPPS